MSDLLELRQPPRRPGHRLGLAVTSLPAASDGRRRDAAVLFGPHPLLGGDLENNVQRALAQECALGGLVAVRFDYRGVGASAAPGDTPRYELWSAAERGGGYEIALEDGTEALQRAARLGDLVLCIGYSFGAWVALTCALRADSVLPLVLVAPPLEQMDFSGLVDYPGPVTLVCAGRDTLDPPSPVEELRARFPRARIEVRPEDDHFFRGAEAGLAREALAESLGRAS